MITLDQAVRHPDTLARYDSYVYRTPMSRGCLVWTGAISDGGHGRFWLDDGVVAIAHRFGWAVYNGPEDVLDPSVVVMHTCDEAICQQPEHWKLGNSATNSADWAERRRIPGNPLRDRRGAEGRARALRDAARSRGDLDAAAAAGLCDVDLWQPTLDAGTEIQGEWGRQ